MVSSRTSYADDSPIETIVVTGTLFNPDSAPAKASLDTTEPQTIINRSYIEDSTSPVADYVTILAIAPSLTGTDINGPGLSEGSVKNTLRGLPDGQYGMTYDSIPFGDTNGPSHHSASYFPGATIGAIDVDRGPGNAGNLGAATYGGSINMFSEPLTADTRVKLVGSYGSFKTTDGGVNFQSGDITGLGQTRALLILDAASSDGALTFQDIKRHTALLKVESTITTGWVVTAFSTYTQLQEHLNDNNGATPAQIATYGKNFALQDTNPALPTFNGYNFTNKWTDMDYVRLKGDVTNGLTIDNTAYTYAYVNQTFTARSILQTASDIAAGTSHGQGGSLTPIIGGVKQTASDIPGYTKLNAYRVWGNIFRASQDFDVDSVTGQIRVGLWWETAGTERSRYDYDVTKCYNLGINPYLDPSTQCQDSSLSPKSAVLVSGQGYAEYQEHSGWKQYEPFLELEINPVEELTLTPGIKYIDWKHSTDAVLEPKLLKPLDASFTTTRTLPFFEANYKIQPSWSVYAQYAEGIYIPDISSFEQKTPVAVFPEPQTTTNYQLGTVYYADNFTIDGDVYYIPVKNNIVFQDCSLAPVNGIKGETCGVNTGQALYKGVEAEATYTFDSDAFDGVFHGLSIFVNGSVMSAKSNGLWLKQAPNWTAAGGIIYKRNGLKLSLIDKAVGEQFPDTVNNPLYKIGSYSNLDFNVSYDFGYLEVGIGVFNLADSRNVLSITENDSVFQTNRLNSIDQYFYQPERSVMVTAKAHF